ncbi:hypothetical protein H5T58_03420, partial [Candidatus Parcubacteria bacterium]|nr:hypothetical protein [Candidatus Parcubacteria bacterium]
METKNLLSILKEKKVLILGFGKEGKDAFLFLRKLFPEKEIGIADKDKKVKDKKLKKVKWYLGKNYLLATKNYEIVIKSPGIPIHLPEIEKAFKEGKILTPTQIFFELQKSKVVGVTGTKGKSTTTKLIYEILKAGKKKVKLIGNIGKPYLASLLT